MKLRNTNGTCAYRQPEAVDSQDEPWLALEEEWLALPATKGPYPTATLVEELELFMYVCSFEVLPEISRTTLHASKNAVCKGDVSPA